MHQKTSTTYETALLLLGAFSKIYLKRSDRGPKGRGSKALTIFRERIGGLEAVGVGVGLGYRLWKWSVRGVLDGWEWNLF